MDADNPAGASASATGSAGADPLDIGFVGFGRAGAALAVALADAGHRIVGVATRSAAAATRARRHLPAAAPLPATELAARVDVLVLAVPDDALAAVATAVASAADPEGPRPGTVVVHLSGRHGLAPLAPVTARAAGRAAIHPIMSLAGLDPAADAAHLRGTTFGVTADPAALPAALRLVADVGGRPVEVADEARTLYHAAMVLGANYLAALAGASADLLAAAGVTDARAALAPLLRVSLDNALRDGDAATTGPVRRGDAGTVAAHLAALRVTDPGVIPAYVALARLAVGRLEAAGLLPAPSTTAVRAALDVTGEA
ncbi:DUF2520 domain-containing protein [Frankia sp. CNm7]|uniref:DUF2520 domain-containing protein n=1 Tax=Frankia nepalensis TaxID=1836974 RepID=A0A937UQW9_9ACTN|nr:Rossmann-like and DUF2520 domain-containing protein [Frankia nepalensis]MBL7496088.1 DUF2520 domain-containing protein [Frankia nepalensis]MBL7511123.1 DUF2520 domain-containing protein [Frankia nepalensis]MBL7522970.1 DUF2520 domain-containing protein [Frankia nepalensis]MBL7630692.1 DUF2520 domain-containing protein [Frankia nepalensis]